MAANAPDFLVIGGMRCGSTSLYKLLKSHPQIYMPQKKELHFFDGRNTELNDDFKTYRKMFSDCKKNQICGEITPDYLSTEGCEDKIAKLLPNVKLVVILREPVARSVSHYMMSVANGVEMESFTKALQLEEERLQQKTDHTDIFLSYQQRSHYAEHLLRFKAAIPNNAIHVIFLEELTTATEQVLTSLWQFLKIDNIPFEKIDISDNFNSSLSMYKQRNQQQAKKLYLYIARFVQKIKLYSLYAYFMNKAYNVATVGLWQKYKLSIAFKPQNEQLKELLNRELPW